MRCFISVTKSITNRKTRRISVTAYTTKSGDLISSHNSFDRCPMIWCIMGMHMAHSVGNNQLRPMALFTPWLLADKLENLIIDFWVFCCFIEFDGERFCSVASIADEELSVDVDVVIVVFVLIDIFFSDNFAPPAILAVDVYIADFCISNSDWIINTMAMSVDELNSKIAAKLELNNPYHSCLWQTMKE